MGHKVHPIAFRLAVTKGWGSTWFARQNFSTFLKEDVQLRDFLWKRLKDSLLDRIEIERSRQKITITLYSAKPGTIIGRAGAGIEELTKAIKKMFYPGRRVDLQVNVKEIQQPSLSARIVGQQIASDLEKRMPFRRIMKMAIERVMKSGAQGVKLTISGRLNGAEIARTETLANGKIPLHNLRADINFASVAAHTIYGAIGVKVWINRGEVFEEKKGSA
ncbi:MAG: 30S ribosomal protein S3 [Candidatus Uhrbacteria bacterium GW2011_GWA2_53_10]|uniref:Small ribosomal subunit protein uS3 n=1 Tax=Candidatus Uhrbacteria bacterium GW2011_GWA2_53_10 TaxID=1618980 RepID=A0A0G1XQ10_9BACT|nr:MAG: 30S ribosomal protein S3 [Candidatus Uhrbacteria bacterium GW2011_GWA2_53_10]